MVQNTLQIKLLDEEFRDYLPSYATEGSAGLDLRAYAHSYYNETLKEYLKQRIIIKSQETKFINTRLAVSIPEGFCGIIIPRSGLGTKHGIILANGTGLIDSDYRGELIVCLWNRSNEPFIINHGDRIAQLVILPVAQFPIEIVDELESTVRGDHGFGSSGVK